MKHNNSIVNDVDKYISGPALDIIREFSGFLSIPNHASSTEDIKRNAVFIKEMFETRGVEIEISELPAAAPFIYGEYKVPDAKRTIFLYAHYDGQPANPSQWNSDPWKPVIRTNTIENGGEVRSLPERGEDIDPDWRIYARSASDDKAPFTAITAALDFIHENNLPIASNLKFIFEGEEEIGSPHLSEYLRLHKDKLQADMLAICDGPVHQSGQPQLYFGARGYAGLDITVYGPNRHLHSGHYGNWAPNPSLLLIHLLASMKDPGGNITIEGFHDEINPLNEEELKIIEQYPDTSDILKKEFGIAQPEGDQNLVERLLLPSCNIRGFNGGAVGKHVQNIIPSSATASIDIRLVKKMDPSRTLDRVEEHIRGQGFHIVREDPDTETRRHHSRIAKIVRHEGYPAVRTKMDSPEAMFIIRAAEQAAGETVALLPTMGASLPLYQFDEVLNVPIVGLPIANYDNNQHGPDENIRIGNLWYGVKLFTALFIGK